MVRSKLTTPTHAGFGTCSPQLGGLRGPGYYNWDLSVQKDFHLTERFKLEFRSDFLNAFNRVNLAAPNTTVAEHHRPDQRITTPAKYPVRVEALLLTETTYNEAGAQTPASFFICACLSAYHVRGLGELLKT